MHQPDSFEELLVGGGVKEPVMEDVQGTEANKAESLVGLVGLANSLLEVVEDLLNVEEELIAHSHVLGDIDQPWVVILLLVRVLMAE